MTRDEVHALVNAYADDEVKGEYPSAFMDALARKTKRERATFYRILKTMANFASTAIDCSHIHFDRPDLTKQVCKDCGAWRAAYEDHNRDGQWGPHLVWSEWGYI